MFSNAQQSYSRYDRPFFRYAIFQCGRTDVLRRRYDIANDGIGPEDAIVSKTTHETFKTHNLKYLQTIISSCSSVMFETPAFFIRENSSLFLLMTNLLSHLPPTRPMLLNAQQSYSRHARSILPLRHFSMLWFGNSSVKMRHRE